MSIEVDLTLLANQVISAKDKDSYEKKRDALIAKMEKLGFDVNIEDEFNGDEADDEDCIEECDDECAA